METIRFDALYRSTFIGKIDGRVKTLSTFILLFTVTAMQDIYIPLFMLVVVLTFVAILKIPLKKLVYPLYVASVVFVVILFTVPYGKTVWSWYMFKITQGGIYIATLILIKVIVCVSLLLILVSTTRMYEIVSALSWLPDEVIDITFLMLRYIETLSQTSKKIYMAAKSRGAFSKTLPFWKRTYNMGSLAGILILRAVDRAERVYLSMVARGYTGKVSINKKVDANVVLRVLPVLILCIVAIYVDRFILKAPYVIGG